MLKDYYKILEISPIASPEEITKSYRRLAHIWHPDKSKHPEAHERFIEIKEAYTVLSSPIHKQTYDNLYNIHFAKPQIKVAPTYEKQKQEFEEIVNNIRIKIKVDLIKMVDNTLIEIFAFIERIVLPILGIIALIFMLYYIFD